MQLRKRTFAAAIPIRTSGSAQRSPRQNSKGWKGFVKSRNAWLSGTRSHPDELRFSDDLVGDSRLYSGHFARFDPNDKKAILIAITWRDRVPRFITIERTSATTGAELGKIYTTSLGPGSFFYHFSLDQIGQMTLRIKIRRPNKVITYDD